MSGDVVYPRRPPRLELFAKTEPFYIVTFNTYRRMPVLANRDVFETFCLFCRRGNQERGVKVGRFVIMPDHVHLFVWIPASGISLGSWVKALKTVLGKVLAGMEIPRPFWQEGFFDHLLRHQESYDEKWDYVRLNPVRAGLVEKPEDWPWQGEGYL
jgi:putative transposase